LKKILLLSDSHGYIDQKIIKYFDDVDEVWHAGDIGNLKVCEIILKTKPLKAVFGNIDNFEIREKFHEDLNFHCEGLKIYITHIGGYPGNYDKRVKKVIEKNRPNIFICGHSHILKVIYDKKNDLLHMNPGACGLQGFHKKRTMLKFDIKNKKITNLNVIELGRK
tara:strand:- start:151 stop:645 length:495 start_codon:yes stop_codon:yes gene_type:complete